MNTMFDATLSGLLLGFILGCIATFAMRRLVFLYEHQTKILRGGEQSQNEQVKVYSSAKQLRDLLAPSAFIIIMPVTSYLERVVGMQLSFWQIALAFLTLWFAMLMALWFYLRLFYKTEWLNELIWWGE